MPLTENISGVMKGAVGTESQFNGLREAGLFGVVTDKENRFGYIPANGSPVTMLASSPDSVPYVEEIDGSELITIQQGDTQKAIRISSLGEWSGSLVLGETNTTAYRGDRGKIAYDHSQVTGSNPHATAFAQIASTPGSVSAIAALSPESGTMPRYTGSSAAELISVSNYMAGVLATPDSAACRSGLGLTGWATKAFTNGTTSDVAEGSNLYFTASRAVAACSPSAIGAEEDLGLPSSSGRVLASTTAGVRSWVTLPTAPVSSVYGRTGAVVAASGDYTTAQVTENPSYLYFTEARVRGSALTGYTVGANTALAGTDTILVAFGKIQGQLNAKQATLTNPVTGTATAGQIATWTASGVIGGGTDLTYDGTYLSSPGAKFSQLTDGQMVHAGPNGILRSDTGLVYVRQSNTTREIVLGNGTLAAAPYFSVRASSGQPSGFRVKRPDETLHWALSRSAAGAAFQLINYDATSTLVDAPVAVYDGAGGVIEFGGTGTTKRDANFTGNLQVGGSQFLSSGKALNVASALVTALAHGSSGSYLPVAADYLGNVSYRTAAQARSDIGAAASTALANYQPLDSDLTAIAALTTQAFGRSLLTQADAASARTAIGAQGRRTLLSEAGYTPVSYSGAGYTLTNTTAAPAIPANTLVTGSVLRIVVLFGASVPDYADLIAGLSTNNLATFPTTAYLTTPIGMDSDGIFRTFSSGDLHVEVEAHIGDVTSGTTRRLHYCAKVVAGNGSSPVELFHTNSTIDTSVALYPHLAFDLANSGSITRYSYFAELIQPN